MANVALIKIFPGLNIGVAQLSSELQVAGHQSKIIFFKDRVVDIYDENSMPEEYRITQHPSVSEFITKKGITRKTPDYYKPFSEKEYRLLIEQLNQFQPDLIGFSVHSGMINEAGEVTAELKKHFDLPVIWGGAGPTLEPDRCLSMTDIICTGEGDEVIVELANRIDRRQELSGVIGTWSRLNGEEIKTPKRELPAMDSLAAPNWDPDFYIKIDNDALETRVDPLENKEFGIITQRGCPFSCSFCIESKHQELFGKKEHLRRKSPQLVIEELKAAKENLDIETIWFYDDVFTINPRWLKEFLPLYKKEIDMPFWCFTYPTTHNKETLQLLKDHGCTSVSMGVQTGSQRLLNGVMNRPTDLDRVIEAAQEIVDTGLVGQFDLIVKIHAETVEDMEETFQMLLRMPKEMVTYSFAEMVVYPTYQYKTDIDQIISTNDDLEQTYKGGSQFVNDEDNQYFVKLYRLTRTKMPVEKIKAIAADPKYRQDHNLLNPYLGWDNWIEEVKEWRRLVPVDKKKFSYSMEQKQEAV